MCAFFLLFPFLLSFLSPFLYLRKVQDLHDASGVVAVGKRWFVRLMCVQYLSIRILRLCPRSWNDSEGEYSSKCGILAQDLRVWRVSAIKFMVELEYVVDRHPCHFQLFLVRRSMQDSDLQHRGYKTPLLSPFFWEKEIFFLHFLCRRLNIFRWTCS